MKRTLVTGGNGFIGSELCRRLVEKEGHQVMNLDNLTYASTLESTKSIISNQNYSFRQVDIVNTREVYAALSEFRPNAVLHLAAESHVDRSISGPDQFVKTNVLGTVSMLKATRQYLSEQVAVDHTRFRFLHISTDEVFGAISKHEPPFTELSQYDPSSPYSASKAASDLFVKAWHKTFDLPTIITNCSNNYGPFQFPEKLIPLCIARAIRKEKIPVYGKGENVRDWIHVEDHVSALLAILNIGAVGETYCIGGNAERTNLQVVQKICSELDAALVLPSNLSTSRLISFVTDRPGHDFRYAINNAKLERTTGWKAKHSFENGLASTVKWYIENEAWWSNKLK